MNWTPITTPPSAAGFYVIRRGGVDVIVAWDGTDWRNADGSLFLTQEGDQWAGPIDPGQLISPEL